MESDSKETPDGFDVLNGIEIIVNTIKEERDSEKLLWKMCGKVLDIFNVDRAWLLFPCDPRSPSWKVPVERSVPEFPGANIQGLTVDMTPDVAGIFQTALDRRSPVIYGPGGLPLAENTKSFQVKSQLSMAILPRTGKPWQFGIHQCSYERIWKETEIKLFQTIGIMTAEALGSILLFNKLKQRAAELSNLAEKLFTVQEEERRTLARELHDEVGQTLTAIKTDAVCIRENCSGCSPEVGESVAGILEKTDSVYDIAHRIMRRLRPRPLDDLGLRSALDECIFSARLKEQGITVHVRYSGEIDRLDDPTNISIYRILQEALTNISRHAKAKNVWVTVERLPAPPPLAHLSPGAEVVQLVVRDDGLGMQSGQSPKGLGLVGIRERVTTLNGSFELTKTLGEGLTISVTIPIGEGEGK